MMGMLCFGFFFLRPVLCKSREGRADGYSTRFLMAVVK